MLSVRLLIRLTISSKLHTPFSAISTNLFFILVVFLLSWYHWSDATWLRNLQVRYARFTNQLQTKASSVILSSTSSLRDEEEYNFLDEKFDIADAGDADADADDQLLAKDSDKTSKTSDVQTLRQRKVKEKA